MTDPSGVRCMLMRGGTSKGAYFVGGDVPADPEARDDLLRRIMGSPDPSQIDGVGGAHPLTSKVAIVSASPEPDVDLDYLFLQVGVGEATVSTAQTCGNLLAGVGPFAVERGLVPAGDPTTSVRIRLLNTGDVAAAVFATPGGTVEYDGEASIDGVPGTAGAIELETGVGAEGRLILPTGSVTDDLAGHVVTIVDNGMPVVLLRADEFGVTGAETPAELEARSELTDAVEQVRLAAGELLGLGDVTGETVPKMFLLSAPQGAGAISTRAFIPRRVHTSIGVLMAASVAAGIRIPGAVGHDLARLADGDTAIEHPSGMFSAVVRIAETPEGWRAVHTANIRTARKLFDGVVFPRPRR